MDFSIPFTGRRIHCTVKHSRFSYGSGLTVEIPRTCSENMASVDTDAESLSLHSPHLTHDFVELLELTAAFAVLACGRF